MENNEKVEQNSSVSEPAQNVSKNKKIKKSAVAIAMLVVIAMGGVGFGVYNLVVSSSRIAELEGQVADRDETIAKLKQEGDENEQPETPAENADDLAKNLLISRPEQYLGNDNQPFIYELRSDFGEFFVHLERQVGGPVEGPEGDILMPTKLSGEIRRTQFNNLERTEEFEITGINANQVADVFVGGFGNGMGDETMLFLMEDGTVEYMPIMKAYEEKSYHSYGKIPGVENVIKFMHGDYSHIPYGPYRNVFAQRADGKFYSLAEILGSIMGE